MFTSETTVRGLQTPPSQPVPNRYHRQTIVPGIGTAGAARIGAGHAIIIGVGALGCAVAELLARAGVGMLTLLDRDVVDLTNLQRQCLFSEADAADRVPKALAASRRLAAINSSIVVRPFVADFSARNWADFLPAPDQPAPLLLDGTDNFETRYLLNDIAVSRGCTYFYAGVIMCRAMTAAFTPGGPCLRCIFPDPPAPGTQPTCDTAGVLGPAVQVAAALQAAAALRLLVGDSPEPFLIDTDVWTGEQRRVRLSRQTGCPCCDMRHFEFLSRAADDTTTLCGAGSLQHWPHDARTIDLPLIAQRLRPMAEVTVSPFMLRARIRETHGPMEMSLFADGRALFRGITDPADARTLYARYVGC